MYNGRRFLSSPPTGSPRAWRSWSFSAKDSEGQSTHAKLAHAKLSTCTSQIVTAIYLFTRATRGDRWNSKSSILWTSDIKVIYFRWFISFRWIRFRMLGCAANKNVLSLLMSFIFSRLRLAIDSRAMSLQKFLRVLSISHECGRGRTLILRNCRVEGCSQ